MYMLFSMKITGCLGMCMLFFCDFLHKFLSNTNVPACFQNLEERMLLVRMYLQDRSFGETICAADEPGAAGAGISRRQALNSSTIALWSSSLKASKPTTLEATWAVRCFLNQDVPFAWGRQAK
jgi:hypothetical protein